MCSLPAVLMVGGMYMQQKAVRQQAQAYEEQAIEDQKTANFNAGQALIEQKQSQLQALSFQNGRLDQLDEEMQANDAWFAFLGRETPTELLEYQKKKAYDEIGRGDLMAYLSGSQSIMQANQEIRRGSNAIRQGGLKASAARTTGFASMLGGAYNAYQVFG